MIEPNKRESIIALTSIVKAMTSGGIIIDICENEYSDHISFALFSQELQSYDFKKFKIFHIDTDIRVFNNKIYGNVNQDFLDLNFYISHFVDDPTNEFARRIQRNIEDSYGYSDTITNSQVISSSLILLWSTAVKASNSFDSKLYRQ